MRKQHPNDPALLALEGDFYAAIRDYEGASRAFDAALKLRPSAAISVRAYQARRDGRLREATAPLEAWVAKKPDEFAVQAVLAEAYANGGQRRKAREKYEFIADNAPPNAVVLNNLAWLYYETEDARAESTAARAYQLMPTNPSIADTYGWILVENDKVAEGLKILKPVEAGGGPDVKYHYAAALARSGDVNGARQRLKTLLDSNEPFSAQADARRLMQELSTP
jgi:Flp pilus assembly protein TadD